MRIIKSFFIAFSIYSKIPVPQFEWKEEDMKYMLCFFPWVGAVIGGVLYLWNYICRMFGVGELCYCVVGAAIPVLITGGIHVDGFIDTMDAFHSYQPKEKKLEILKDAHIGAFAVIMFAVYGLLYLGAFSEIRDEKLFRMVCGIFFLARCLSGISVVSFPSAKKDGMLYLFANNAERRIVKGSLVLQCGLGIVFLLFQAGYAAIFVILMAFLTFGYYYYRSKKELGGITGDTAGYFVLICECGVLIVTAVINLLG